MKNYYASLSGLIYDFTKPVGTSVDGDLEFYFDQVKEIDGKVLEAGVGTGRMLIPFLRKGVNIEGIDNSREMLDICKINCEKYNQSPALYEGDLIEFEFESKYDAILMPTGTICLIENREDVRKLLRKFKSILSEQGKIIIDLIYPNQFKPNSKHEFVYKINDEQSVKLINESYEIDWPNQKTNSNIIYENYENQNLIETQVQKFNLNWYGINEFQEMLKSVGFKEIEVVKNYGIKRLLNLKTITIIAK